MNFSISRPDVVRAINQRWLLKFWHRHLGASRVPRWQTVEAEDLSRVSATMNFLDVTGSGIGLRYQIRFHGPDVGQVYGLTDCRGKFLDEIVPPAARTNGFAPHRQAVESGRPVYTIHDVTDRAGRLVHYERLLLPFARDGENVDRLVTSFEFICEDGAFERAGLMTAQSSPPALRLSATIESPASP